MAVDPEHPVVPEEHAELRRSLDVGLTRLEGRIALLTQRDEQNAKDLEELGARVAALERTRWPLPALAVLAAVGALVVAVWQAVGR